MTENQASTDGVNSALEASLELAADGDRAAITRFFEEFLRGPLYYPHRIQQHKLTDQPEYPNDLVHVLGIKDVERVVVPVFTAGDYIKGWCGLPLSYRSRSGVELLKSIPEGWWIVVNPGFEVQKEISPWELERLAPNEEAIREIVAEHFADEDQHIDTYGIRQLRDDEYPEVTAKLVGEAKLHESVQTLYIGEQEGETVDEEVHNRLVVGIAVAEETTPEVMTELQDLFSRTIAPLLIGQPAARVLVGISPQDSLSLSFFQNWPELYSSSLPK